MVSTFDTLLTLPNMETNEFYAVLIAHERSLKGYALKLTKNPDDASDLVQETFLRAILNKDKYNDDNIEAWLTTILRNIFINNHTKLSNKNSVKGALNGEDNAIVNTYGHHETAEQHLNICDISKCVANLSEDLLMPMKMFVCGYKYKEIADETHIPIGTVKSRIFYARKIMGNRLRDFQ